MSVYVEATQTDHDDFPVGNKMQIGPFDNENEAHVFLRESHWFKESYYSSAEYPIFKLKNAQYSSVSVNSMDRLLSDPQHYL